MALFDDASLVVTPNGYKEGTLSSIKPTSGLGDMTVVRATTATRVNSAGLIELVPRNLLTYSNTFTNGDWSPSQATLTSGQSGYDGTSNAYKIQATGTNCYLYQGSFNFSRNQSVYAKAGNYTQISFIVGGYNNGVQFNLTTGTIANNTNSSYYTPSIESVGNGWYRCSVAVSSAAPTYGFLFAPNFVAGGNSASGDFIYIQNAQAEVGSTATEYFPTTTRLNIPRLDYSNGSCPSLLVEPQRTNISLYSQQFDNINWSKENSSITSNQLISPDGNLTADIITDNSTNDRHIIFEAFTGDFSTSRTFSTYAKQGSLRYLVLSITSINDSASCYSAIFDLQTGTITATKNNGTATVTASIQNAGNGWYRCIISGTLGIGVLAYFPIIGTSNRATFTGSLVNNNIPVYVGSGQSLYIWGAQLEAGSYPTSYIPTTSAAVTRNADVISKTGISSLIGQTEGTIFADAYLTGTDTSNGSILIATDKASSGAIIRIIYANGVALRFDVFDGSSFQCLISAGAYNVGDRVKVAGAYKNNDFVMYVNGTQIGTDVSGTVPATDKANINTSIYGDTNGSRINSAILFPTRLTNAELASLTTI